MREVYCITWPGTRTIHKDGCYFDREHAEKHLKVCNKALRWWHGLFGDRWYIQTLKVKESKTLIADKSNLPPEVF